MAKSTTPAEVKPEAKRKIRTQAEIVADLEQQLLAARAKAEAKATAGQTKLREQLAKLVEKRDALNAQITELEAKLTPQAPAEAVAEDSSES